MPLEEAHPDGRACITKGIIGEISRDNLATTKSRSIKGPTPLKEITYLSVKVGGVVKLEEDKMILDIAFSKEYIVSKYANSVSKRLVIISDNTNIIYGYKCIQMLKTVDN